MTRAAIGLGANLGDAVATLRAAAVELAAVATVVARSSLYRTPAWGVVDQPDFINAVILIDTDLDAHALLRACKAIEARLGRVESYRWGPRAIDCDILFFGTERIATPDLIVPHARLHERAFALVPLAEIDPSYATLRDALASDERASIERIGAFDAEASPR